MRYSITKTVPVARFYYQGSHSHPVKRTVLVIESNKDSLTGYELREGSTTRPFACAPIKTYNRCRIARSYQCRKDSTAYQQSVRVATTLKRQNLIKIVTEGV